MNNLLMNENLLYNDGVQVKRLLYRSWYRGCKETDQVVGRFAKKHLGSFDDNELVMFEEILQESDSDLFNWISGKKSLPEKYKNHKIMQLLLAFNIAGTDF